MSLAIGVGVALLVMAGLVYFLTEPETTAPKVDGPKIIAAGRAYTRELVSRQLPIPNSVSVSDLVAHGYLKPADVAAFQGLDATLSLISDASRPDFVIMRVRMADDSDLVLLQDGSVREVPNKKP
jgi:hypothetical protein